MSEFEPGGRPVFQKEEFSVEEAQSAAEVADAAKRAREFIESNFPDKLEDGMVDNFINYCRIVERGGINRTETFQHYLVEVEAILNK